MCGIVGIVANKPIMCRDLLVRQRDTMRHRGPDDAGVWWSDDGHVGLAQRRLSIIDLSPAGHQPMSDSTGELHVVLNGEIYNFRELKRELSSKGHIFRTLSDTEVLLEAYREWGTGCVDHFIGMFAFGLYDSSRRCLFLARDRAGEKPLFFRIADGALTFASELKALLADPSAPRSMDKEALDHYLAYGYVPSPLCLIAGFRKLAPAHMMEFFPDSGNLRIRRYWCLPEAHIGAASDSAELVDELHELLHSAVKMQLMADVPVGVLLSGGLDSSLVTAMASEASPHPVRTFTISFPGNDAFDEGPFARIVASHFGTRHTDLVAEPATVGLLPELARQYDEPIADSSMVPTYLVSKLIRGECKVALGGDGGDELFGGYHAYSFMLRQQQIYNCIPVLLRRPIALLAGRIPVGVRGRTYLMSLGANIAESLAYAGIYFDARTRQRIAPAIRESHAMSPELFRIGIQNERASTVQQLTRTDFLNYLPEDILVKVDRASMLASLEVRAPFLDHRVIDFAFGRLADSQRATASAKKVLLRELGRQVLPSSLHLDRKQGFSLPLQAWFKGEWGSFMEDVLRSAPAELYDKKAVEILVSGQRRGLSNAHRLFGLTFLELWRREYNVSVPL